MWDQACQFIRRPEEEKNTNATVKVPGLARPLTPWQFYAVFVLLNWFVDGRNGGLLADVMGLGKVSSISLLYCYQHESNSVPK